MPDEDVRANEEAKWKPNVVIMVAGTDFDVDVLDFIEAHGFVAYRREAGSFKRLD